MHMAVYSDCDAEVTGLVICFDLLHNFLQSKDTLTEVFGCQDIVIEAQKLILIIEELVSYLHFVLGVFYFFQASVVDHILLRLQLICPKEILGLPIAVLKFIVHLVIVDGPEGNVIMNFHLLTGRLNNGFRLIQYEDSLRQVIKVR